MRRHDSISVGAVRAYRGRIRWGALSATFLLALSGCSGEDDKSMPGRPPGRICDGTLNKSAADSLRRLAGTGRFTELTGTNEVGEPNRFSLEKAASHLHKETPERSRCTVYRADDDSGIPLIQIDFKAADRYPDREKTDQNQARKTVFYDIGAYASTKGNDSTSLYFRCQSSDGKENTEYVNAGMFSTGSKLKGSFKSSDRMNILNSVARHVATQLKCSDEAGLPVEVTEKEGE
ncbi:hypothetical protein ACFYQQ_35455 [Streptomyces sp. NPDC005496]|uniref:hypothetical protein n=1 Tax=unclassified Streptomyces TaxID=2593676 RepID=UPI0033B98EC1